jgi:pSer/pThr/pTyr-binding forkhead associated (FHA) protein/S1-C subfamily serine protease
LLLGATLAVMAAGTDACAFDVKKVEASVFKIYTWRFNAKKGMGSGTGFLVNGRRILVTNYHVIANGEKYYIGYRDGRDGKLVEARVVERRAHIDLAILEAYEDLPGKALTLGDYEPEKLANVVAVGYPGAADVKQDPTVRSLPELYQAMKEPSSFDSTITPGMVSRIYSATNTALSETQVLNARTVQHNAAINPGNSGGPLFDACGAVVGVNSFFPKGAQGVFFSIHAGEVTRFLREQNIAYSTIGRPCLSASLSSGSGLMIPLLVAMSAALALAAMFFAMRKGHSMATIGQYVSGLTRMRRPPALLTREARTPVPLMNWANPAGAISLQSTATDGQSYGLDGGRALVVGRGRQCEIAIDNDTVSTSHVRLQYNPQSQLVAVTDLGSSNGTFVNGSRVTSAQAQVGDLLRFGTAEFRLAAGAAPAPPANRALPSRGWMLSGFDPSGRALQFELRPTPESGGTGDATTAWTIGRDRNRAQFLIDDASVSGAHAQIAYVPREGLILRDLGSTNGTRIDGEALGARVVTLKDTGQEIAFGAAKLRLSRLLS